MTAKSASRPATGPASGPVGTRAPGGEAQPVRDMSLLAEQRRRARRTAIVLGIVVLCVYFGFILITGLR